MAVFPADTCILVAGYTEEFDPSVERTDMERGPPKMRVINSNVVAKLRCALLFDSTDDVGIVAKALGGGQLDGTMRQRFGMAPRGFPTG